MNTDERAIRDLISAWMEATRAGEVEKILPLMAEDVVFLLPGRPPMRGRDAFVHAAGGPGRMEIEAQSAIQEIHISGELAYCWSYLQIQVTPPGGAPVRRSGNVLTVFRKEPAGNWVLWRDANLLTTETQGAA